MSVENVGLAIFRKQSDTEPSLLSVYPHPRNITDMEWEDGILYAADGGLLILDVRDPALPTLISQVEAGGIRLAKSNSHLFMSGADNGLQVFDVSEPEEPKHLFDGSECDRCGPKSEWNSDIQIDGERLYLLTQGGGFKVFNVRKPSSPLQIMEILPEDYVHDVDYIGTLQVKDSFVFTAKGVSRAFKLSGSRDVEQWWRDFQCHVHFGDIAISDNVGFVSSSIYDISVGLSVFNLENPQEPVLIGNYQSNIVGTPASHPISLSGNHIVLNTGVGFELIDVSRPSHPTFAGDFKSPLEYYEHGPFQGGGILQSLSADGDFVYLASRGKLEIIDINDAQNPKPIGYLEDPAIGNPVSVLSKDDMLYITNTLGFCMIDVSNTNVPTLVASVSKPTSRYADVKVMDHFAVLAAEMYGVHVMDIEDASHPDTIWGHRFHTLGGTLDDEDLWKPVSPLGSVWQIELEDRFAYVHSNSIRYGKYGITAMDLTDPRHPSQLESFYYEPEYEMTPYFEVASGLCYVPLKVEDTYTRQIPHHFRLSILKIREPLLFTTLQVENGVLHIEWDGGTPPYQLSVYDQINGLPNFKVATENPWYDLPIVGSSSFLKIESAK